MRKDESSKNLKQNTKDEIGFNGDEYDREPKKMTFGIFGRKWLFG